MSPSSIEAHFHIKLCIIYTSASKWFTRLTLKSLIESQLTYTLDHFHDPAPNNVLNTRFCSKIRWIIFKSAPKFDLDCIHEMGSPNSKN